MPTLRRSKSLNDKISRQKNRSGDVVRDPRSPDVEGRTRTCVDNFQALVHLRKQTEDKARQLELAYNYATNGHTYLPRGPVGGVELPYSNLTIASPTAASTSAATGSRLARQLDQTDTKILTTSVQRRQRSAEGRTERDSRGVIVRRQESFTESHQSRRSQFQKCPRPMSMVEPRMGNLFPTQDELSRKDQVIQNLTESQKSLNVHNQQLLSKIDELEFENNRLKDILSEQHFHTGTFSRGPQCPQTRPHRSISIHGDVVRVSGSRVPSSTVVSPNSETSVSGYGSLVDSPSGDGFNAGLDTGIGREMMGRMIGMGEYNDDTLPLSGVSECSLESRNDTLAQTSSSSSRSSRPPTLNLDSDKSDSELHTEKVDRPKEQKKRGSGKERSRRIEELAKQVAELSSQRDTVLFRYKQLVEENQRLTRRNKSVQEELGSLLEQHGEHLDLMIRSELEIIEEQLKDLGEDVLLQVQAALDTLISPSPASSSNGSTPASADPLDKEMLDKLVDLIGGDYQKLGQRLSVSQQEIDRTGYSRETSAQKTRCVLQTWLKSRKETDRMANNRHSARLPPACHDLDMALRDIDKDIKHCAYAPVSAPERQALKNCLQCAIDHVTDPRDLLDHLIALNELSPAGISFVQEVLDKRERALSRLWHVSEYRGTGVVSRLALALDRSHCPQVSHTLRDELELQNSRVHSQSHPASEEPATSSAATSSVSISPPTCSTVSTSSAPTSTASPPPQSVTSRPPADSQLRSRPLSRVPRLRSKTVGESVPHPVKPPAVPGTRVSPSPQSRAAPSPLRQVSASRKARETSASKKETRSSGIIQRDRGNLASKEEKTNNNETSQKKRPDPLQQKQQQKQQQQQQQQQQQEPTEGRIVPSLKERPFSPFQKERPGMPSKREELGVSPKERPFSPVEKDRSGIPSQKKGSAAILCKKDRPLSAIEMARSTTPSQRPFSPLEKERSATNSQKGPANSSQRARTFSPFEKDRPATPSQKEGPAPTSQRTRPFSPFENRPATPSLKEGPTPVSQRARPFSPFENRPATPSQKEGPDLASQRARPFSPFEKDRTTMNSQKEGQAASSPRARPFSPFEKDSKPIHSQKEGTPSSGQRARPFSHYQERPISFAQKEKSTAASQRERPFSPFEKDRQVKLAQKERPTVSSLREKPPPHSQRIDRPFSPVQNETKPLSSSQKGKAPLCLEEDSLFSTTAVHERVVPPPPTDVQAVWDIQIGTNSATDATGASARNSIILEEGSRISRV